MGQLECTGSQKLSSTRRTEKTGRRLDTRTGVLSLGDAGGDGAPLTPRGPLVPSPATVAGRGVAALELTWVGGWPDDWWSVRHSGRASSARVALDATALIRTSYGAGRAGAGAGAGAA